MPDHPVPEDHPPVIHHTERLSLAELHSHPRNYRRHGPEQLTHLAESLREHGVYQNVVVAKDHTLLAGHGVVAAAEAVGLTELPVIVLDLAPDDPRALKVLTGDNELARLAEIDERGLADLLKEVGDTDIDGLLGTGFDEAMLANLLVMTRPGTEIADLDAAMAWAGLPEFEGEGPRITLTLRFDTEEDRDRFIDQESLVINNKVRQAWSAWWPPRERADLVSLHFDQTDA